MKVGTSFDSPVYEYVGPTRYDYLSTDHPATLTTNKLVRVPGDNAPAQVYKYIGGATLTNPNLDPSVQHYATNSNWALVTNVLAGQNYSDTTKWRKVSALEGSSYQDPQNWKQLDVNGNAPDDVQAFTKDSSIDASGLLHVSASSSRTIDAVVVSVAVGVALGVELSVGVAAAGVYAENRIHGDVQAYVQGGSGVTAGSATIEAHDSSHIKSVAGAAALSAAIGGEIGVAISIGISIAFNEVSVDVGAYVKNTTLTTMTERSSLG